MIHVKRCCFIGTSLLQANTALQASGYAILDDDNSETTTFTFTCGTETGKFLINTGTGVLSYGLNYDVDTPNNYPTSVTCTVTVTDKVGLSATASLDITISKAVYQSFCYLIKFTLDLHVLRWTHCPLWFSPFEMSVSLEYIYLSPNTNFIPLMLFGIILFIF